MAEINEVVRITVQLNNGDEAVQVVRLVNDQFEALQGTLAATGTAARKTGKEVVESVDQIGDRLESNLIEPYLRAALTIEQVRNAQRDLNRAFAQGANTQQRQRIAQIRREYDALEDEIIQVAEAQDLYTSQLNSFGAQGSAGAASLIQLSRGIEDVRFGLFAAVNNIEPFLTSLRRLEDISASTGESVRSQLTNALRSPAGLLFTFQAILTVGQFLRPVIDTLFDGGIENAEEFDEALDAVLGSIIEIQEESTFTFEIEQEGLQQTADEIQGVLDQVNAEIASLNTLQPTALRGDGLVGPAGAGAFTARILTELEEQQRDAALERRVVLEEITSELTKQLEIQRAREAVLEELRNVESDVAKVVEESNEEDEASVRSVARLRERLARELANTRKELLEDEVASEIAAVEETFRRRLALARDLGDAEAQAELEAALDERRIQIRAEAEEKTLNELAEARAKADDALLQARIAAEDNALAQSLAREERALARRVALAEAANAPEIAAELERVSQERRFQIFNEFQRKRTEAELRRQEEVARARERLEREQARELERIQREAQRFTDAFVGSIQEAIFSTRQFTDSEIDLTRDQFDAEEAALRESLERRLIDQEEYSLQVRAINEERAAFERDVEEDNRTFIQRALRGITDFAIAELGRQASAFLAQQIAIRIFAQQQAAAAAAASIAAMTAVGAAAAPAAAAVSIATFGGAAASGGAAAATAITSITALVRSLQLAATGFQDGGYTGNLNRSSVAGVVHGGEWVYEQPLVSQDPRAFGALHGYLRKGGSLTDLLFLNGISGFQGGGPVSPIPTSSVFRVAGVTEVSGEVDGNNVISTAILRLEQQMQALANRPIQVNITQRNSRALLENASVQEKDVTPRTVDA